MPPLPCFLFHLFRSLVFPVLDEVMGNGCLGRFRPTYSLLSRLAASESVPCMPTESLLSQGRACESVLCNASSHIETRSFGIVQLERAFEGWGMPREYAGHLLVSVEQYEHSVSSVRSEIVYGWVVCPTQSQLRA